jgi:hypothetical protein
LLSPPRERQREGKRPSKVCRIKNVDAHSKHNTGDLADVEFDFVQVTSVLPNRKITPSGDAAVGIAFRDTGVVSMLVKSLTRLFSTFAAGFFVTSIFALEVTEPAGAAHGYPGLCDMNGKKLANGEFRQWVENKRLRVTITYKFPDGELYEEQAQFRQQPELIQEKWSWKESKDGKSQREFAADFLSGIASAHVREENQDVSGKIKVEPGRTFAGFGFSIALSNLRKRLLGGEKVQLKAVGFSPFPTLSPQVVTVTISHGGLDRMRMSGRLVKGDRFIVHPEIFFLAKLFVDVPDTNIWLTSPGPAGFLRWEGPVLLPTDPLIRVDLLSGEKSRSAEPVKSESE